MGERSQTIDIELQAVRGAALRQSGYAALFLLLQGPVVAAVWTDMDAWEATNTLRLALALQVAFGVALGLAGYRVAEFLLVRERRLMDRDLMELEQQMRAGRDEAKADLENRMERRLRYLVAGCGFVVATGAVAALEVLTRLGPVDVNDSGLQRIATPWLLPVWLLLLLAGVALLTGVRFRLLPREKLPSFPDQGEKWRHVVREKVAEASVKPGEAALSADLQPPASEKDRPGTIITCSGGGIRSASFCLGALQALTTAKIYHGSNAVVGVSGGGYMAAAFHNTGRDLGPGDPPPFAHGTPELALLRRHTRYLLPNPVETFRGVLSMVWGVLVNLVLIAVVLRALAWILGWYLYRFEVVTERGDSLTLDLPTWWIVFALAPWGISAAAFVLHDKAVERFVTTSDVVRRAVRRTIKVGLLAGTATAVLMLGVPLTLEGLDNLAGSQGTLPDAITRLTKPGAWAYGSLAATVTVLITLGRTVWKGLEAVPKEGALGTFASKLRTALAPWLGTVIIAAVILVLLVRWTEGYATSTGWRADWQTGLVFAALFLLVSGTDANRTSLHHFYRERLASAYLVKRTRAESADAVDYELPMRVSDFAGSNGNGGPQLLMAAAANVADPDFVPAGRGCVPFVICAEQTGIAGDRSLPAGGAQPTRLYESFADFDGRDLTVPAAMAISGAAFSPLVGRASARTRPVRVLLTVLNARLGVWLPNPYFSPPGLITRAGEKNAAWHLKWRARLMSAVGKPGPYRLLREAFGQPSLNDRKLYVTDGGHYDNLGLLEALRRKPERIFVIDASNDKENTFGTLADAIATARMDLGVEVSVKVTDLCSSDEGNTRASKAWAGGSATHATHEGGTATTEIFYLKAIMLNDLTNDLEHYARQNPDFPRRSTGRQLYDEWDFEAYRELGESLAEGMIGDLRPQPSLPPEETSETLQDLETSGAEQDAVSQDLAHDLAAGPTEEIIIEAPELGPDPTQPPASDTAADTAVTRPP